MTERTLDISNEVTAPNHYNAHTNIEQASVSSLAADAECAYPDSKDSPGAVLLNGVRTMVLESWEGAFPLEDRGGDVRDLLEVDWHDTAHNIADAAPSVYTHELWTQFVDLAAYRELDEVVSDGLLEVSHDSTSDMGPEFTIPAICLYNIARRLASVLLERLVEALQADVDNLDEADDES
ncbi:OCR-like antirestriction protein [Rhodococcus phage ChewyVIII]|uniref:OCR-like antirestriction protein n=1 Tax=Rhodococcus phage ChewyVIII TaxID=1887657 RepID=A0A1C9EIA3_9CAUD|nr:OCR-like antirestriction protein [Rhodococcus phage ChewyVIII]AON97507.1 OCR-like antirestriction protein [Rhodococcus phage ChewyVIII]